MAYEVEVSSSLDIAGRPAGMLNLSNIPTVEIAADPQMRELAASISRWVDNARAATGRSSLFDRGAFLPPDNPYDQMRTARRAVTEDPLVGGVADTTEGMAFNGVKWESPDADESDVFNQIAIDQNLDAVVRAMWREEFTYNQFVAANLWGWRTYTVRGQTKKGNSRKRSFRVWAPLQIRLLDPTKVVPVGLGPLSGERLAWQSTLNEIGYYQQSYTGEVIDPMMIQFFEGTYNPSADEAAMLAGLHVDPSRLLALNPAYVWRHTTTKPDYERFPDLSLKSCFALLDLKRQLMQSDRATLVGSANYILLIKKGLPNEPALPEEVAHLKENYNFIAKMPVIISDHRLEIELIAPKVDFTLTSEKYDTIDSRLLNRLLGTLTVGGRGQRNETQETIAFAVARTMENRRHMLKRALEVNIARAITQHPNNVGLFTTEPNLVYTPRNVAFNLDPSYVQGLLALRTQREISRETILEYFGLDEETEAMRMEIESETYDHIFMTQIPFAAPGAGGAPAQPAELPKGPPPANAPDKPKTPPAQPKPAAKPVAKKPAATTPNGTPESPKVSGGRGGRPAGGGKSPQSPQGQTKPRTPRGNPKTGK